MASSIEFEGVVKAFGGLRAVDALDLRIEPGEMFFLLGPSGCGKTTLLRCLAGFATPDSGRIRIDGEDITRVAPHRRDTGMVFQSYALWPHMTVLENVEFGLRMRRTPAADATRRALEALALVRMEDRAAARPNQLSGGQQQRVALARALVVRPRCLLLDEPLSNLDAKLRLEMRAEIRRICKESGLTSLYVTHDQKEALSMADRLAVLRSGRIEQCGAPRDVYARPRNRFVAGFIGETNFLPGRVVSAGGGRVTVRTGVGDWTGVAVEPGLEAGRAVTLSVRPEAFHLSEGAGPEPNSFGGVLSDTLYLGEVAQHRVDLPAAGGEPARLKVFELRPRFGARDAERVPVRVSALPDDVVVLADAGP